MTRIPITTDQILGWMTDYHIPLQLLREEGGEWVVVDASTDQLVGAGGTCREALLQAYGNYLLSTASGGQ